MNVIQYIYIIIYDIITTSIVLGFVDFKEVLEPRSGKAAARSPEGTAEQPWALTRHMH